VPASPTDEDVLFFYRPHHVVNSATASMAPKFSMNFGQPIAGVPAPAASTGTATPDPADACIEKFTRIIGGVNSGAIWNWDLSQEVIGVDASSEGTILIYLKEAAGENIIRLMSIGQGGTWKVDADTEGNAYVYATGYSPTIFGNLLFYFRGDALYCKNLAAISEGVYDGKQEQLNRLDVGLVAVGLTGHKVAVNTDPNGRVTVFYLNSSGHVTAAISNTSGKTWKYLQNW
jgi:hypothetical protein